MAAQGTVDLSVTREEVSAQYCGAGHLWLAHVSVKLAKLAHPIRSEHAVNSVYKMHIIYPEAISVSLCRS